MDAEDEQTQPSRGCTSIITKLGLISSPVDKDGACFFHSVGALAKAASKKIHAATTLRAMTCDELARDEINFVRAWDGVIPTAEPSKGSWKDYVKHMRKADTWAGELEAMALSRVIDCTIYIVRPGQPTVQCGQGKWSIWVKLDGKHFEPLRTNGEASGSTARREHAKCIHEALRWLSPSHFDKVTRFRAGGGSSVSYAPTLAKSASYAPTLAARSRSASYAPTLNAQSSSHRKEVSPNSSRLPNRSEVLQGLGPENRQNRSASYAPTLTAPMLTVSSDHAKRGNKRPRQSSPVGPSYAPSLAAPIAIKDKAKRAAAAKALAQHVLTTSAHRGAGFINQQREIAARARVHRKQYKWICNPQLNEHTGVWSCGTCGDQATSAYELVSHRSRSCGNGMGRSRTFPVSKPEKRRILEEIGIATLGRRGRRLPAQEIRRRAEAVSATDSAGCTSNPNRWEGWTCPHPGCDFVMPSDKAYTAAIRRRHLRLHSKKVKTPNYTLSASDKRAAKAGYYNLKVKQLAAFNVAAPAWTHQYAIDISLDDHMSAPRGEGRRVGLPHKCLKCNQSGNRFNEMLSKPICGDQKRPPKNAAQLIPALWRTISSEVHLASKRETKMRYWHREQARGLPGATVARS